MQIQQPLAPFIWYQSGAEDAVAHYLKVFGQTRAASRTRSVGARTRQAPPARSCCSISSCAVCR